MAVTFVGEDSGQEGSNTTGITLTLPTHVADDFGIIYGRADEQGTVPVLSIGTATGWTLKRNENPTTGRDRVEYYWYKKFTSSSETNPVMNIDTAQEHSASVHVFRGVDTTTPFDVVEVFNSGANDPTPTNPAITPVTANGCLFLTSGVTHGDISVAVLPATPASMTLGAVELGLHRNNINCYLLDYGSAATITPSAWQNTNSNTRGEWSVCTFALRPQQDGITSVTPDEFDMDTASVVVAGTDFETPQNGGTVDIGTVDVTSAVTAWSDTSITLDLTDLSAGELASLHTQGVGALDLKVTNDSATEYTQSITLHRPQAFETVAGALTEGNTTERLAMSGTFGGGKATETVNPNVTAVDLASDEDREDLWLIQGKTNAREVQYDFRVLYGTGVAETVTQTPQVTIGSTSITGTVAYTNADDTSAASGNLGQKGTLAETNADDTSAAQGDTTISGSLAETNADDTSAASGDVNITGTLAETNSDDTSTASGDVQISGSLAETNADDTSVASGNLTQVGTVAYTNLDDSSVASGNLEQKGTLATTNADDTSEAEGEVSGGTITGTLATTNADDTSVASGDTTIDGTSATTNEDDTSTTSGSVGEAATIGGHFVWPDKKKKKLSKLVEEQTKESLLEQLEEEKYAFNTAPEEVKKQARVISDPYEQLNKKKRAALDIEILRLDIIRLQYLLQAWEIAKREEEEEEEIIMLITQDLI